MTDAAPLGFTPIPGMAPVFPGWNVWGVWQKNDLDVELTMIGVGRDRRLRIWVENEVDDNAPGAEVGDPLSPNPKKFKGEMVQIIANDAGLPRVIGKELGSAGVVLDGPPELRFVRFYNRGPLTALPWPHDSNYLLDAVYLPSPTNPVTNAPEPPSAAADIDAAGDAAAAAAKSIGSGVVVVLGIGLGLAVVAAIASRKH